MQKKVADLKTVENKSLMNISPRNQAAHLKQDNSPSENEEVVVVAHKPMISREEFVKKVIFIIVILKML